MDRSKELRLAKEEIGFQFSHVFSDMDRTTPGDMTGNELREVSI